MTFDKTLTFEQRMAAAEKRNKETAACNGREDCTSKVHLSLCKAKR